MRPRFLLKSTLVLALLAIAFVLLTSHYLGRVQAHPPAERAAAAADNVRPALERDLTAAGLRFGDPVFLRIFKEERVLELWVQQPSKATFQFFRTWPVAAMSGDLGPKTIEGDRQAPEGFYYVASKHLNPRSHYHLSFNLGYPNAYDQANGRTGSNLMVHGSNVSIGCFAMTDPGIEEIYTLGAAALAKGQPFFRVHIFPFRMTNERMAQAAGNRWEDFWKNLKQGHDLFEQSHVPPEVTVKDKRYVFAKPTS